MSDSGDNVKYKWTPESTSLLVSVWSDKQVQKQLEYTSKPQLIWESVARYMKKKGYNVSGKQCRSRMKQVLVCYREAKKVGTRAGVEQYYELIDRVLKNKQVEENNMVGVDTVDAMINVKSPPKDVKTNKNLQMRHKFQEHIPTLHRTEALTPTWALGGCDNEYPDSPESNETVIARPNRIFSPTKDAAINTREQLIHIAGKSTQCNILPVEDQLHINHKQNLLPNYNFGEVPFQNTVQNVQNQIIQENMQQSQNLQHNHMYCQPNMLANNFNLQQNLQNLNQGVTRQSINVPMQVNPMVVQTPNLNHIIQQQNQLQQMMQANNRAMPQEPRKIALEQNLASTYRQQYDTLLTHMPGIINTKQTESPDYSPDVSQNLNDAFCQSKNDEKTYGLNETYNRIVQGPNPLGMQNPEISVVTNNATYNDDSLLECLMDSPTPSENNNKTKSTPVDVDNIPHVPLRKKKVQKLEQLVLSAINSQNEVVNKILSAQNDMVTKFLDIDRDRQNRLENRLDDLLKVVHASVATKTSENDIQIPPPPAEPTITSLVPPPRPGAAPPKLDLVPPKPCRVPCTIANANIQLINQNTVVTRPGVVSPITSPVKKPGTIWSKLGPVSQSPFVKAQQRLGLQPIVHTETRTQSSAERRIIRELEKTIDIKTLIFETKKFLDVEKQLEEKIQNAYLLEATSKIPHSRRKLFTQREPSAAMILTATFLENERRTSEQLTKSNDVSNINNKKLKNTDDHLLSGQGESYERLRHLDIHSNYAHDKPSDTSTPAKFGTISNNNERISAVAPKQTIQQLSRLVMNSGRWKDIGVQSEPQNQGHAFQSNAQKYQTNAQIRRSVPSNETFVAEQPISISKENEAKIDQNHICDWMFDKYKDPIKEQKIVHGSSCNVVNQKPNYPVGFTKSVSNTGYLKEKESNGEMCKPNDINAIPECKQSVRFMDEALAELQRMYIETVAKEQEMNDSLPYVVGNGNALPQQNQQMIEKYIHEIIPRKQLKDRDTDSDNDEFLDTTATMHVIAPRRSSLTSTGTASSETTRSTKFMKPENCIIS